VNAPNLRRVGLAAALSSAVAFAAVPAIAQERGTDPAYESKIRLKNAAPAYHGKVKSESDMCIANRKVRLFKERRSGEDKVLGKTRTDSGGYWEVLKDPKSGVYYAKVNRFEGDGFACLPAKSKKVVID
jgi:hypothetical protein